MKKDGTLGEKAIYNCLNSYFMEHFGEYEQTAGFYANPEDNIWKFKIPGVKETIILECDIHTGKVNERRY